jgi:hypothetical protein
MSRPDGTKVVFVSHKWCNRDNAIVLRIVSYLRSRRIVANSLLVDPVVPTHSISGTESARIGEADCFVVMWTPEAAASAGVGRETTRARESGRPVVLIRYLDTALPDWYDPDSAYIALTRRMLLPCPPSSVPIFPGLIDYAFGAKDLAPTVGREIIRYLDSDGQPRDRST